MFSISKIFLLFLASSGARAAPFHSKRIAQTISDSNVKWRSACVAAGGGENCSNVAVAAFGTLLAAAGPCDQQNAGDQMINLAKQLNNNAEMIKLTQIFVQQPRNTPSSESVPYCQQPPKNQELAGLFQCQFAGAKTQQFVGGVQVGGPGTMPLGHTSPLNPPGSCPAHLSGPIPDGQQLVDITQDPGTPGVNDSSNQNNPPTPANPNTPTNTPDDTNTPTDTTTTPDDTNTPDNANPPVAPMPAPTPTSSSGTGFKLQNGKDAQNLNAQFAKLTADSSCTEGTNACVQGAFAQCVNGKFVLMPCSSTLVCAALPLVNSPGTSIACTTQQDALQRIANTGVQGGLDGSG